MEDRYVRHSPAIHRVIPDYTLIGTYYQKHHVTALSQRVVRVLYSHIIEILFGNP
jgi:hypothetical protein